MKDIKAKNIKKAKIIGEKSYEDSPSYNSRMQQDSVLENM